MIASILWTGATESIRRGQALSHVEPLRVAPVTQPAVLPAQTPVQVALDLPNVVVTRTIAAYRAWSSLALGGVVPPGLDPAARSSPR